MNLPQIVPRDRVIEVTERVDKKGRVVVALREEEARAAIERLVAAACRVDRGLAAVELRQPGPRGAAGRDPRARAPQLYVSARLSPAPRDARVRAHDDDRAQLLHGAARRAYTDGSRPADPPPACACRSRSCRASAARCRPTRHVRRIALRSGRPAASSARPISAPRRPADIIAADMGGTSFDVSVLRGRPRSPYPRVMLRRAFSPAYRRSTCTPSARAAAASAGSTSRGAARSDRERRSRAGPRAPTARGHRADRHRRTRWRLESSQPAVVPSRLGGRLTRSPRRRLRAVAR